MKFAPNHRYTPLLEILYHTILLRHRRSVSRNGSVHDWSGGGAHCLEMVPNLNYTSIMPNHNYTTILPNHNCTTILYYYITLQPPPISGSRRSDSRWERRRLQVVGMGAQHGRFLIKHGRFLIDHGRVPIQHGGRFFLPRRREPSSTSTTPTRTTANLRTKHGHHPQALSNQSGHFPILNGRFQPNTGTFQSYSGAFFLLSRRRRVPSGTPGAAARRQSPWLTHTGTG